MSWLLSRLALTLALAVTIVSLDARSVGQSPGIVEYGLVRMASDATMVEYELRGRLQNGPAAVDGIAARIANVPAGIVVMDGALAFGPIDAGASGWSTDTFTVRVPHGAKTLLLQIEWAIDVPSGNYPPIADAGADRTVSLFETVQLDGSASFDPDGDPLTYAWVLVSRPAGSQAALTDSSAVRPTLVIDAPGTYALQLVVHDGQASSEADVVILRTENSPPIADAGVDQSVAVGDEVQLDGSGSSDVDGDPLTYRWSLVVRPIGSAAALDDPAAVAPRLHVDVPGVYVAQLIVNDGATDSDPDTVTITTLNSRPVANAGADQSVVAGQPAALDGSASFDPDGDPLTFAWSIVSRPDGSAAALADPTAAQTSFVADLPGDYVLQLIVSDGTLASVPDTVLVTTTNVPPVADAGDDQLGVDEGARVVLDGTASFDPDGHPLTYSWTLLVRPSNSAAVLEQASSAQPEIVTDAAGDYIVQLIVHDGFTASAPDTVRIQAVAPNVVTLRATDDEASEVGPDPGAFTLSRTGATDAPLTVNLLITGSATNGVDYSTIPTSVTIPSGQEALVIDLVPVDDGVLEGDENVLLSVQPGSGYTAEVPSVALIVIVDSSRPRVTVTASGTSASEAGPVAGRFTFTRTGAVDEPLLVQFSRSGSATNGLDYASIGGNTAFVTIPAGSSSVDLPIVPLADNAVEPAETVVVTLMEADGYLIGDSATATVTIEDDPARITVTASQPNASEAGPVAGEIVFRRTGGLISVALGLEVAFGGTATLSDFVAVTPLSFAAGQDELIVPIVPRADNLVEGNETLAVSVGARPSYVVDGGPAVVTIADDPAIVTVVATDPDASESGDTGQFTFFRSGGNRDAALVLFVSRSGTATSGSDYVSIGGATIVVTIPAGEDSVALTIAPIASAAVEPDETVILTIIGRPDYTIGTPGTATVTIREGM